MDEHLKCFESQSGWIDDWLNGWIHIKLKHLRMKPLVERMNRWTVEMFWILIWLINSTNHPFNQIEFQTISTIHPWFQSDTFLILIWIQLIIHSTRLKVKIFHPFIWMFQSDKFLTLMWIHPIIHSTNHLFNQIKVQNISTIHPFNQRV